MPALDQPVCDIGIGEGEGFGRRRILRGEHRYSAVDRIRKRAGDDQLAAFMGVPSMAEMLGPELRPLFEIVRGALVKEEEVFLDRFSSAFARSFARSARLRRRWVAGVEGRRGRRRVHRL
jgi:hypothetical protein